MLLLEFTMELVLLLIVVAGFRERVDAARRERGEDGRERELVAAGDGKEREL